ncbi:hypothetical protein [Pseudomonas lopnurensis]|uniref:hypothetical protein n=1 Tax=Pseudomonas lopnurensis TaxID=1477517 RepID=UPI0028B14FC6|nr:hypothetical protein [Pseudomonas lopnurensis]
MKAIPENVKDRIKIKAAREWPSDFEMQQHTIEKQLEAYTELVGIKEKFNNHEFVSPIIEFSSSSWPDDYEMELYTFNKQFDAGIAFFEYEAPDVPSEIFEQIKLKAFSEWPDDHEMKLHTLENQIEAWRNLQNF